MRLVVPSLLLLALACAGPGEKPAPAEPRAPAVAEPVARSAPAVPDPGASIGEMWLVILGSKRDPTEKIPSIETIAAHPELGVTPRVLLSSRYKNLMPCLAVTFADATPDKAAALALSKKLTAMGVDNYVKNAGAWVGPSDAIDGYCASRDAVASAAVHPLVAEYGLWVPVDVPAEVAEAVLASAPPVRSMGEGYDAWEQPLAIRNAGTFSVGQPFRVVDVSTGAALSCRVERFAALTLGTPHFGVMQQEKPPRAPTCGTAAIFAELGCDTPGLGMYVGAPEGGSPLVPYRPVGEGSAGMVEAAKLALTAETDWEAPPEVTDEELTRDVSVDLFEGPGGRFALVNGRRTSGNGLCGGEDAVWTAIHRVEGDALGAPLAPFFADTSLDAAYLVDVEGDGVPERVQHSFPRVLSVHRADGTVIGSHTIDYCDCPC